MEIDIRATAPDEYRRAASAFAAALLFQPATDEEWEQRKESWDDGWSFSAWDGDRCVGHVGAFRFQSTVPGGASIGLAGITRVGVLPTHTRQGLLTRMMRMQLETARADGYPLAGLRASEAVIYSRYGFEVAAEGVAAEITTREAGAVRSPAPGSMRLLVPDEIVDVVDPLYDRVGRWRVGSLSRTTWFVKRSIGLNPEPKKATFVAVHTDPSGTDDGYVAYTVDWKADHRDIELGAGDILELVGADAAVERALWSYLLQIDLIRTWRVDNRPVDDPIRFAFRDQRAYRLLDRWDEQWLRILDVEAALTARTYGPSTASVTIGVTDPLFSDNCGTWRVDAEGAERISLAVTDADLVAEIGGVSAAYLGGTTWTQVVGAGVVHEQRPGAAAEADSLFASTPHPFCGTFY